MVSASRPTGGELPQHFARHLSRRTNQRHPRSPFSVPLPIQVELLGWGLCTVSRGRCAKKTSCEHEHWVQSWWRIRACRPGADQPASCDYPTRRSSETLSSSGLRPPRLARASSTMTRPVRHTSSKSSGSGPADR